MQPRSATAAQLLARFTDRLAPELLSLDGSRWLFQLAERLPLPMVSKYYFESHLEPGVSRTDLILGIEEPGREILAGENPVFRVRSPTPDPGFWDGVAELCRDWSPSGPLAAARICWLEFDQPVDPASTKPGFPRLFLEFGVESDIRSVARELRGRPWIGRFVDSREDGPWRRLDACIEAVPDDAFVCSLGLRPDSREPLRLCVAGLYEHSVTGYLDAIGGPGGARALEPWLMRLGRAREQPSTGYLVADLDIGTEVGPRLGIECLLDRRSQQKGSIREAGLMDSLVREGLCSEDRRRALDGWVGVESARLPLTLEPSTVVRSLNHVKLSFAPDGETTAKAYLSLRARSWPRRRARGDESEAAAPARPSDPRL